LLGYRQPELAMCSLGFDNYNSVLGAGRVLSSVLSSSVQQLVGSELKNWVLKKQENTVSSTIL